MAASSQNPSLFITGLTNEVTPQTLHEAFIPFGEIASISLPKPELKSSQDPHRGFATLTFQHYADATEALENMDQAELFGRVLTVRLAKEAKAEGEKLGARTAVWEQEGYAAKYGGAGAEEGDATVEGEGGDAMQGLEGLDVAGPKRQ